MQTIAVIKMDEQFQLTTSANTAHLLDSMRSSCKKHVAEWKDYEIDVAEEAVIIQRRRKLTRFPWPIFSADLCAEIEKTDGDLNKLLVDTNIGPAPKQFVLTIVCVAVAFQSFWLGLSAPHTTKQWIGYAIVNVSTFAFIIVTALLSYRQAKSDVLKMVEIMRQLHNEL
jgi:hypothetical protein